MNFKETINSLKERFQARITAESTAEEIETYNGFIKDLEELDTSHDELVSEHAKTKDTLVRMVTNQGSVDKPVDASTGSNPKSIEECVKEELEKGGK